MFYVSPILMIMDKKMSDDENIRHILIDPHVTPFSLEEDILTWKNELQGIQYVMGTFKI